MKKQPLETLYIELHQSLLDWLQQRVNNHTVAEDLLQTIFLKAQQAHQRNDDINHPVAWIYQIARNTVIDYYRQKKMFESITDDLLVNSEDFIDKSLTQCLRPLILQLPDKYREALLTIDLQEGNMQQLADQEGVSLSAIKSRVSRGRKQLKQQLLDCCQVQLSIHGEIEDFFPHSKGCC
jgi:RNA polymerase sigma-70 factor (ECF subfamily)